MSKDAYDENADERMGANTIITASADFKSIKVYTVGVRAGGRVGGRVGGGPTAHWVPMAMARAQHALPAGGPRKHAPFSRPADWWTSAARHALPHAARSACSAPPRRCHSHPFSCPTPASHARAQEVSPLRGFSSAKFLPSSRDTVIIALKSEENSERKRQTAYFTVFGQAEDGAGWRVLMDEVEIPGEAKMEGLEVLSWGTGSA